MDGARLVGRPPGEVPSKMPDENDPFQDLGVQEAIDLRWALRDIRAKRWKWTPIDPSRLEKLKSMGLIEMPDDEPVPTNAGINAIP